MSNVCLRAQLFNNNSSHSVLHCVFSADGYSACALFMFNHRFILTAIRFLTKAPRLLLVLGYLPIVFSDLRYWGLNAI
jgi:hypothetical protein